MPGDRRKPPRRQIGQHEVPASKIILAITEAYNKGADTFKLNLRTWEAVGLRDRAITGPTRCK